MGHLQPAIAACHLHSYVTLRPLGLIRLSFDPCCGVQLGMPAALFQAAPGRAVKATAAASCGMGNHLEQCLPLAEMPPDTASPFSLWEQLYTQQPE